MIINAELYDLLLIISDAQAQGSEFFFIPYVTTFLQRIYL